MAAMLDNPVSPLSSRRKREADVWTARSWRRLRAPIPLARLTDRSPIAFVRSAVDGVLLQTTGHYLPAVFPDGFSAVILLHKRAVPPDEERGNEAVKNLAIFLDSDRTCARVREDSLRDGYRIAKLLGRSVQSRYEPRRRCEMGGSD